MKKIMFLAFASMVMFACSNDDESSPQVPVDDGGITFELAAVNQMSDGLSRAPVYSQEAVQHVTNVNVYAFQKISPSADYTYVKTYPIAGWTDGSTFKRYAVQPTDNLPQGDYRFLAVGRDATDMFTLTSLTPSTKYQDMMASVAAAGNETEIFSGSTAATIASQGSRVAIQMMRKVAGILGYFKNVPQNLNGSAVQFLRLTITSSNTQVNLITGVGSTSVPVPPAYDILNIDLSGQSVNADGVYTGNDLSSAGVVKVDNSQLGGTFYLPVGGVQMTLGLYDAGGIALKTWVVKDSNGGATIFDIVANNFYSLGIKAQAGSTTGGTPDPGDDDAPIDLLTDQNITITISPAWDLIHNMVIQ